MSTPMRRPAPSQAQPGPSSPAAEAGNSSVPAATQDATSMAVAGEVATASEEVMEGVGLSLRPAAYEPFNGRGPIIVNPSLLEDSGSPRVLPPILMVGAVPYIGYGDAEATRKRVLARAQAAVRRGDLSEADHGRMKAISNGNFWVMADRTARGEDGWTLQGLGEVLKAWDNRVIPQTPILLAAREENLFAAAFIREMRSFELGYYSTLKEADPAHVDRRVAQDLVDRPEPEFWIETQPLSGEALVARFRYEASMGDMRTLTGAPEVVERANKIRQDVFTVAEHVLVGKGEIEDRLLNTLKEQVKADWWVKQDKKFGHGVQEIALYAALPFMKSDKAEGPQGYKFDPDFQEAMRIRQRLASWCLEVPAGREVFDIFLKENTVGFWVAADKLPFNDFLKSAAGRLDELKDVALAKPGRKKKEVSELGRESFRLGDGHAELLAYLERATPVI